MKLKMNSEKVIYFTQVAETSEDISLMAAEAANKYHKLFMISFSEDILKYYHKMIPSLLNENVVVEYRIINAEILTSVVKDFVRNIIEDDADSIYYINLASEEITKCDNPIHIINEFINNKSHNKTKDDFEEYLNGSSLSGDTKFEILKIYKIINNLEKDIDCFYKGDSFIVKDVNMKRYNYSALDSLKLEELEILIRKIELYKNTEYSVLSKNVLIKTKELKSYCNFIPSTVDNINNRHGRNIYNHGGFPGIYKLISVIQFESALKCLMFDISNLAFLHLIRSLDVYIDGFLIFIERASLGDYQYIDKNTGQIKRHRDVFLLKGKMISGITPKLNEINDLLDSSIFESVKKIIMLRNSLILTHGNVKVCHEICREAVGIVKSAIINLEEKNQHRGFEWSVLREKFRDLMEYTYADHIIDCIYIKFGLKKSSL